MCKYYSIDGDKIGNKLEFLIVNKNEAELSDFSNKVSNAINNISELILINKFRIIFSGGDNILFHGEYDISICRELMDRFFRMTGSCISIGIGNTMLESFLALKLAKAKGGAVICDFSEVFANE